MWWWSLLVCIYASSLAWRKIIWWLLERNGTHQYQGVRWKYWNSWYPNFLSHVSYFLFLFLSSKIFKLSLGDIDLTVTTLWANSADDKLFFLYLQKFGYSEVPQLLMSSHNIFWKTGENYPRIIIKYSPITNPLRLQPNKWSYPKHLSQDLEFHSWEYSFMDEQSVDWNQ